MLKDSINLIYGLNSFEDFYNPCNQQYESADHVYTPDHIGWSDGRISLKIDEDTLQYFPYQEIWKINNSKVLLRDYLETKNIKGSEEALFWRALQDSVNSESIDLDFDFIINRLLLIEGSKKEKKRVEKLEEDILYEMKDVLKELSPIIGNLTYDHTEVWKWCYLCDSTTVYSFYSKKYGYIKLTASSTISGRHGISMDTRYPKTIDYICKNKRFFQMDREEYR